LRTLQIPQVENPKKITNVENLTKFPKLRTLKNHQC
jgi:hypothetical protein